MKRILQILLFVTAMFSMQSFDAIRSVGDVTVYICETGKVYHATKDCRGLANATHKVKAISLSEAQKTRRPCKICY